MVPARQAGGFGCKMDGGPLSSKALAGFVRPTKGVDNSGGSTHNLYAISYGIMHGITYIIVLGMGSAC